LDARGRRSTASNARSRHEKPRDRTKAKTDSVSSSHAKNCSEQTRSGTEGEEEMILRTVIGLIALLVSSAAQSNYFTYQSWLAMSESSRVAYLSGAFDSLVSFAETEQIAMHYGKCIDAAKMTNFQLTANMLNFAKDKPELHTGLVQRALLKYLIAACGEPPTK
jgi:hypothetical protein